MVDDITVELFGSLRRHAGGKVAVAVKAATIRDMLKALGKSYPGLAPHLERGVSVSIDGRIYTDSMFQTVSAKNEVVLLPRIAGG